MAVEILYEDILGHPFVDSYYNNFFEHFDVISRV